MIHLIARLHGETVLPSSVVGIEYDTVSSPLIIPMLTTLIQLGGVPGVATLATPGFLAVLGLAGVATFLLYAEHPRLSRRAVVALVPWMVAGAGLSVLAGTAEYPARVEPAVSGIGAYLTTYAVVCLAWFALLQLRRANDTEGSGIPLLIGTMGVGTALVIVSSLFVNAGEVSGAQFFWLAVSPIAAATVAGVVLLMLGLWYPEAAAYTGAVGGLVVFGHALSAIATAVAVVSGPGGHSSLSWAVLNLLATVGAAGLVGLDQQLLWAWGFVWTKLLLALLAVIALTAYSRAHPDRGNLVLGAVGAVGVVGGATVLLSMVVA